jgi:predicted NBD/HSP70 family sugar kinase
MNTSALLRTGPVERQNNRARLLSQLRRPRSTRAIDPWRRTGLSAAAVSTITSDLIGSGVFIESADEPSPETARGRPRVMLSLNAGYARVAAASLRMDVVDAVVADFAGRILAREEFPCSTRSLTGEQVTAQCALAIDTVLARVPGPPPRAIGLAVQGIINPTVGRQIWSPILSIRDSDIVSPLADHFRVPIVMENDGTATALAAAQREPALRDGLVGVLMAGHGVGMGLLVDGGPFPGTRGASSEIGHVRRQPSGAQCRCGQRGCIEAYLADYALYRDARSLANLSITSHQQPSEEQMVDLVRRAERGEPHIASLFREAGVALADAVRVVASVLGPNRIGLAGSAMRGFHLMRPSFEQGLRESLTPTIDPETDVVLVPGGIELITAGMVHLALEQVDAAVTVDAAGA